MRNKNRKNSKHNKRNRRNKRTRYNLRFLPKFQALVKCQALSLIQPVAMASEGPGPSIDIGESGVLRIFDKDSAYPDLVPRGDVPESLIVDMMRWFQCASKIQVEGYDGDSMRAAIPDHDGFYATMHSVDDCIFVAVAHEEHGTFFAFGIAPEASRGSQNMWTQFGGEGKQPSGPWCLEALNHIALKGIFARAIGGCVWLMEFERAFAWAWIDFTRACKNFVVITDPVTGEKRVEKKK